jgi:hypothetical protein
MKRKINKKPIYFRKFGFELEFSTPFDDVAKIVKPLILRIYGPKMLSIDQLFNNSNNNHFKKWELKYDGSTECEITTPISTMKKFDDIEKVVTSIKNKNIQVTHKDSVHVHMQANDAPKHNIIAAWIQIEATLLNCFPKHRRNNTYCEKLIGEKERKHKISDFFINAEEESFNHHSIVSLQYYDERKTVEFRMMEGNLNANEIKQWVKFCMLFLNYAAKIDPVQIICTEKKGKMKLDDMIELLRIEDKEVITFLILREKMFKK